mmetsp:Transcript_46285/g.62971  ORF Transcript_46285/g.62971 Transcript_46285/m.62971 type:complete len:118 (+) Transcript_46285:352-705(+)
MSSSQSLALQLTSITQENLIKNCGAFFSVFLIWECLREKMKTRRFYSSLAFVYIHDARYLNRDRKIKTHYNVFHVWIEENCGCLPGLLKISRIFASKSITAEEGTVSYRQQTRLSRK